MRGPLSNHILANANPFTSPQERNFMERQSEAIVHRNPQLLNSLLALPRLSGGAHRALIALISFRNKATGQCNPGYAKLYERLGLAGTESDRRKLTRWLAELRGAGVLTSGKRRFGGVVWYEFPGLFNGTFRVPSNGTFRVPSNGTFGVPSNGTFGVPLEAPYPLYEQTKGNTLRAGARIPPRKSIQSETLERYYATYGRTNA